MNSIVNENDFKYYMQDIERHYIGCRYSYEEILNNEMVPFKFKTIISRYLKTEVSYETTLESHFYYLTRDTEDYQIFRTTRKTVSIRKRADGHDNP